MLDFDTVALDEKQRSVVIVDQTKLPGETVFLSLKTQEEIKDAIYRLKVRGAPAIGVTAAMGFYLASLETSRESPEALLIRLKKARDFLASARPTAVNLCWALDRMMNKAIQYKNLTVSEIQDVLRKEAMDIRNEDIEVCKRIGAFGLELLKPGDGILTHCNAGHLATVRYGTATAPIYLAEEKDYRLRVFADETRPLLQGARITAYELQRAGVDVTLICDNMSAAVMRQGWIQSVFVGCDRVAQNGDTANKIGTSVLAAVARQYQVPFYVCAPTSTIDKRARCGMDIPLEERDTKEVTEMWYESPMAPTGVKVYNPSFDITNHTLITGIVTEYGILYPPFDAAIRNLPE